MSTEMFNKLVCNVLINLGRKEDFCNLVHALLVSLFELHVRVDVGSN